MEMEQVRTELHKLKSDFGEMRELLSEIHQAIVGNPITKDGGLVVRVINAEKTLEDMEQRFLKAENRLEQKILENKTLLTEEITNKEKKQIRYNFMVVVTWSCITGAVAFLFAYVISQIFHN